MNPSQKTEVLETELLSEKIIYTHYLFPGLIDTFVRVLDGVYTEPLDDLELNELVDQKEAFISQCLWKEMSRISRTRGTWSVPAGIQDPLVIRLVPVSDDLEDDLYVVGDGKSITGRQVRTQLPGVDLSRAPLAATPSVSLFLQRAELGWTPSVSHIRGWYEAAEQKIELSKP
jgi:hypothetical protein